MVGHNDDHYNDDHYIIILYNDYIITLYNNMECYIAMYFDNNTGVDINS